MKANTAPTSQTMFLLFFSPSIYFHVSFLSSERLSSTEAVGDRLKEGVAINQSLACLGNCIHALAEKSSGKNVRGESYTDELERRKASPAQNWINETPDDKHLVIISICSHLILPLLMFHSTLAVHLIVFPSHSSLFSTVQGIRSHSPAHECIGREFKDRDDCSHQPCGHQLRGDA